MPFVPVTDTIEVETVFELDSQIVENTSYFRKDTGWDETSVSDFLAAMRTLIQTDLMPTLSTALKLIRLIGTLLDAVDSLGVVLNVTPGFAGSVGGSALPNNAALTVTFQTAARGRSARGRNYITGLTTDMQDGINSIEDASVTGWLSYYDALRALAGENGATMVVVSRFSGVDADGKPIPRALGVTNAITGFAVYDRTIDSQRRRLPGRGT